MIIWQPGQKINKDRFIIQGKPLGSGGFGITYKALEPNTGKLYAIKTLNSTMQIREDFAEQQVKFINEALTIKGFDHPHILKVYEVIQAGELFGVVMEYIDGVTLFQYIQNTGQLSESEALLYIDQIGKALEYVHTKEQLHRDIKPQNILLRQNKQEAVLIDFGLTRSIATKSMTNSYTEGYAPIEQYRRKGSFGSHTDVYALAATLYYLLTADGLKKEEEFHPVPATNRKYDDELLPEPKHYNSRISQRVNDAILQGMEIEPEKRTPTVLKFRENLGLVVQQPINNVETLHGTSLHTPPNNQEVELKSAVGMDYRRLRYLLKAGKWKEADVETRRVMLAVAKRENERWLDVEHIDNFPCEDLSIIDKLWVKYSDEKFGFSVQKRIYQGLGGTREYDFEVWTKFWEEVGWGKGAKGLWYRNLTFDKKAPEGHLPWFDVDCGQDYTGIILLSRKDCGWFFSRVETCKLVPVQEILQQNIPIPQPENSSSFFSKVKEIFTHHNSSPQENNQEVQLISSCGMDYRQLRDLLKAGKWEEADVETARVMLAVAKRENERWLDVEHIDNFPCEDLSIIDKLWVKYSDGKFGFSVQKRIYQSLGGTREYNSDIWEKFGDKVGWREKEDLLGYWLSYNYITFDKEAPEGHLPRYVGFGAGGAVWVIVWNSSASLLSRRDL